MTLTETHAHLDYPGFAQDLDAVLERAQVASVGRILTIGTGIESSRRAVALAEQHEMVGAVVGIHPTHAGEAGPDFLDQLRGLATRAKVVALGETGLDYHRLPGEGDDRPLPALAALGAQTSESARIALLQGAVKACQQAVFRAHLELAVELGLNVVIHQRDAWADTLAILREYEGRVRGVFHCFGGTPEQAQEIVAMGHLVSFTGILTFKNAKAVRETAASLPRGTFMVETDCPYLAPEPHRGKRCEPAYVRLVAERLAEVRGETLEQIARETEETVESFFRTGR